MIQRAGLWPLRVVWLALPAGLTTGLGEALADRSRPVGIVVLSLAWALWAGGLLAVLIPRSIGLTALRVVVPASVGLGAWIGADATVPTASRALALAATLLAALLAFLPTTGEALVDGSSYGDEHRVLLRVPAALWFGPLPLAWAVLVGGAAGGLLLLAARQWVLGAIVSVGTAATARFLVVRLHQLSRRWLVFVPAGVVVHDPFTLSEPVLFPRRMLRSIGPAPLENAALDLTGGAAGLALEIAVLDPVVLTPVRRGEDLTEIGVLSILVTPTRPGHTLHLAQASRLPVG